MTKGKGDCFETAYRLALKTQRDGTDNQTDVVHAIVTGTGPLAGRRFAHAWIEHTEHFDLPSDPVQGIDVRMVTDKSNGKETVLPATMYYRLGQVREEPGQLARYTAREALKKGVEAGHYGPWDLTEEEDTG